MTRLHHRAFIRRKRIAAVTLAILLPVSARAAEPMSVGDIARAQARPLVTSGQTPGIAVAILEGDREPKFFAYGDATVAADGAPPRPFRADMLFEIGSNTKLFTTNLLGQRVAAGELRLGDPLSGFAAQLGQLKPATGRITLKELGDFTAGVANSAPLCGAPPTPGCMPSERPTIEAYGPGDMAAYFRAIVPLDFSVTPPEATRAPAPYLYSNFSVGMLGLLLGGAPDKPLGDGAVRGWFDAVQSDIFKPLAMRDTFLKIPARLADRRVSGYDRATALAQVTDGAITGVTLVNPGGDYLVAPQVAITGGNGSGATAVATLEGRAVGSIAVTAPGQGYLPPPQVVFTDGGSTITADAEAVIADGTIIGVRIRHGGAGYQRIPTVTVVGGLGPGGRAASATAHVSNGAVSYVSVDDPGAGYVEPLTVVIAPGKPVPAAAIPAWAPAGALSSTLEDMAKFARAAMRRPAPTVPALLLEGFRVAQTPYACQGTENPPSLKTCPAGATRSALAWMAAPRDRVNGVAPIFSKIGGLPGYWSAVAVMPKHGLGVVVFMNSRPADAAEAGETVDRVADNILYALFYERCDGGRPSAARRCAAPN
ncbi:serine hydrolase [Hansschlegelia zhihuaiae]|uniref:Beta-lactamase-related domain-containing protein n=1 Tax=Hansschlegelia zhihuaiae TaxID=405005 RepID=A0A4Q0MKH4_9HYPH|nr:serine hydrolase [Hansschlegelia zhihuaiae]RXF74267.1 hypothetical protein EK403_05405 [Hansschlegelia zhihuaiae]